MADNEAVPPDVAGNSRRPEYETPDDAGMDRRALDPREGYEVSTEHGFGTYVRAVAQAVDADPSRVHWGFCTSGPTSEAHIVLPPRERLFPGRDLELIWLDTDGWMLAVTRPTGDDRIILGTTTGLPAPPPHSVRALCDDLLHRR